jgi:rhodanese-related sulfurtransferase
MSASPDHQINMTDPEGIILVLSVALLFLMIRLLPRFIAGWRATINPLSLKTLLEKTDKKTILLDVRLADEFHSTMGHIEGSINVPLPELLAHIENDVQFQTLKSERIVLICQTGGRAAIAVRILRQQGYRFALLLEGGMHAWLAEELPVICVQQKSQSNNMI